MGEIDLGLSDGVSFDLISVKKEGWYEEGGGLEREEKKGSKRGNGDTDVGVVEVEV